MLYACKSAFVAYFRNRNFRKFLHCAGGGFLSFRTKIPDGPEGSVIFVITGVTLIV